MLLGSMKADKVTRWICIQYLVIITMVLLEGMPQGTVFFQGEQHQYEQEQI